jgi:carboxymethylenebutenolidase
MKKKVLDLFDDYRDNRRDRRGFLKKLIDISGGAAAAAAMLTVLEKKYGHAREIPEKDSRLDTGYTRYPAEKGEIRAYLARPRGDRKLPGIIVIHENRGLQPHIEDVTRRVALEGFLALAPDALSPIGGTPADPDLARTRIRELDYPSTVQNFVAAVHYLKTHPQTSGKVGCTGFCWGGGMTNQVAVHSVDLDAAVPFYGTQPDPEDVYKIKAAMLCHYGGLDERINTGIEAFKNALKAAGKDYQIFIYEGAQHAFFNDTNPDRYRREAAELAWKRTIAFFKEKLKTET